MTPARLALSLILTILPGVQARAFDRVPPDQRIKDHGDVRLSDDLRSGRYQAGKYAATLDSLTTQGAGSTSDVSGMSIALPGTGNTNTTLQALLLNQPRTPVWMYGILPSASAATNRARLAQALTDGAKFLSFGSGDYSFDQATTIDQDGVTFEGAGNLATTLRTSTTTQDLFRFGTGATFRNSFTLRNLTLAGPANGTMTAGFAVYTNDTFGLTMEKVRVIGYCNGVYTYNAQSPVLTDVYMAGACPKTGKFIQALGSGKGFNMYLTRVGTDGGTGTQPAAGLYVENYDGIFVTDTQFNRSGAGIDFNPTVPTSGQFPNFSHFLGKGISLDNNTSSGMVVRGSGYVFDIRCLQCLVDTNRNSGIAVTGGNLDGFHFAAGESKGNDTHGMHFATGTKNIQITDSLISGNSKPSGGTYNGVQFGKGTHLNTLIANNRIGPSDNLPDSQGYAIGVDIGGGSTVFDGLQLVGNNVRGNIAGRVNANFLSSSFGAEPRVISGNAGLITDRSGIATIGAGAGNITVSHGLGMTPSLADISTAPNVNLGQSYWIDNATARTFRININAGVAFDAPFSWSARVR